LTFDSVRSTETPDTLSFSPISVNIPSAALPNGTMQYILGPILQNSISAEIFSDKFSDENFGQKQHL
jgi:hypothetical protein